MHPELVKRAVITSAASYPQPDAVIAWPFGMGELHADVEWDDGTINHEDVLPEKARWLEASQIPLTVIVGQEDDVEIDKEYLTGQKGANHILIAQNWVDDMKAFTQEKGVECHFSININPGIGHTMGGLLPYS